MKQKQLLLISPYFPPTTEVGAKRAINLVEAIQNSPDWNVIVLASNPFKTIDKDKSLPIPENVEVVYGFQSWWRPFVRTLVKLNFTSKSSVPKNGRPNTSKPFKKRKQKTSYTPFDQYLWDIPGGLRSAKKIIKKQRPDMIWVNADPWSGLLLGHLLNKKYGIPWVADLRDPWTIFKRKMLLRPPIIRNVIHYYERLFFTSCERVIFNSENSFKAYTRAYPVNIIYKFSYIRNAFNPGLFIDANVNHEQTFNFGYFGSFRKYVSSEMILRAFSIFIEKNGVDEKRVRLIFKGNVDAQFWYLVDELGLEKFIDVDEEVNISQTLEVLRSWDILLLLVSPEYKWMIPAKLYDYLVARKPTIAISSNKEVNKIIEETKSGFAVEQSSLEVLADSFTSYFKKGKSDLLDNKHLIGPYDHLTQSERFLEIINQPPPQEPSLIPAEGDSCCVIIVTYNGAKWIEQCIESLYLGKKDPDVVIIDNGSTDNTIGLIERFEKDIKIIHNKENKGFGDANNTGLRDAYGKDYDYYFLLNQDAWIEPDTIEKLINAFRNNPGYELISPIHMNGKGSAFDRGFKKFVNRYKSVGPEFTEEKLGKFENLVEVGFVNAAAWMLSRKCFENIGLFHPLFYHTGEDNNYCHRVLYKGYRIGVVTDTKIFHDREYRVDRYDPKFDFDRETIKDLAKPNKRTLLKHRWIAIVKTLEICTKLQPFQVPPFVFWAYREFPKIVKLVNSFDDEELFSF